ncbi:putative dna polymerase alpha catalytic subunit protein [Zalerion maritima]|uniref:DNA polymerase n=1 Tax=Zalerion maritima TaxID=339359 RepID=A0AAD5RYB5_9PEZI|nr:putative dna polymerase alpha catalytic subunit protein [Zalerion maritima]
MASRAASKRQRFAELKALRASGKKTFDSYEVDDENELYEEVDEDRYKKIVRDRLNQDDFVVDDNGEGYADDGREEWDRPEQYYSESDDDMAVGPKKGGKAGKKAREEEQAKKDANDRDISEYFTKGQAKAPPKVKVVKTKEDDAFLADLLGEVDANIPAPVSRPSKRPRSPERRKARALSPSRDSRQRSNKKARISEEPSPPLQAVADEGDYGDDDMGVGMDMDDEPAPAAPPVPTSDPAPSSPMAKAAERKARIVKMEPDPDEDEDEDDDDDMMEVARTATITAASVNVSGSRRPQKLLKPDPVPATSSPAKASDCDVDASSWNNLTAQLNIVSSQATETRTVGKLDSADAVEADGSLNFFWTDFTEVNGSLCLFGKVLNKKNSAYVSCFVKIDNILRKLFFLPRKYKMQAGEETSEEVEMMDVYSEVDSLMTKMNVNMHKIKACNRKYAFELLDVPKEAQYLKLLYPYTKNPMDANTTGETFSHVFGTNTALFEQFVLWKNIMGPCWLKIKDGDFGTLKNASHCKLEVLVDHPGKMISVLSDSENMEAPRLTIMTLALRTTFNIRENRREILAISARIYDSVSLTDTTPTDKLPSRTFTAVRPNGTSFPTGFEALANNRKRMPIKTFRHEQQILSFFLAQVDLADPDVVMGHQLEGVDYSILLNRLHEKKTHQWSRLGRFRRSTWPASMAKLGGNVFAERQIMSGRLLCDLANDAGKSVMYKCSSWSLTEMCSLYLAGPDNKRRDVDNAAALNTWASTREGFMDYITHMELDTYFITALALRTQILPLTKVLTNLAGNSWARTLTGTRAERNEYILLHEFHRNKYIVPDKQTFRGRRTAEAEESREEEAGAGESKKKDKYKGGLVFEPDKGLYDKYVLVMDFNSLYPSIIQEFNICFTTVDRSATTEGEDAVPDVPAQQDQGVLPRLIATLVQRRRQVKTLMKDKNATSEQLSTWDIRQLALKLTANSMYGCLGYTKSRFYARPLAVLTTFKGREILRSTKELAESKSLQVIYGDTDSVMINANVNCVADALKVGKEFKECVNERYRLLEIDIDNIFRRILLQAKKKYAAINLCEKDGKWVESMEVKGLDMKRREYCALSKEVSGRILNDILSGDDVEVAVTRIHEYLRQISQQMRESKVPTGKYIVYTQLGKDPRDYPNADSMPQVQVALRDLAKGKNVRKGDVISYIITAGDGGSTANASDPASKRAFPPQDVMRAPKIKQEDGTEVPSLQPDVDWYIGKQIFPPVERLCANIMGTSTAQLAENLGLDIKRYSSNSSSSWNGGSGAQDDMEIHPLESQIPDAVRFRDCARLSLRCRACKKTFPFEGLVRSADGMTKDGIVCRNGGCGRLLTTLSVVAQVEAQTRAAAAKYYEGWVCCNDTTCGGRRRQISVYGSRCLGPTGLAEGCLGKMHWEMGEREAYNQLVYFSSLFDVEKAREAVGGSSKDAAATAREVEVDDGHGGKMMVERERVLALAEQNRARFGTVRGAVEAYLKKCGRQWVQMDMLFAKLGFTATA